MTGLSQSSQEVIVERSILFQCRDEVSVSVREVLHTLQHHIVNLPSILFVSGWYLVNLIHLLLWEESFSKESVCQSFGLPRQSTDDLITQLDQYCVTMVGTLRLLVWAWTNCTQTIQVIERMTVSMNYIQYWSYFWGNWISQILSSYKK